MGSENVREQIARTFLVKPNESRIVLYNLGLFVLLGVGMALGRGTADALLFKRYGIEYLPIVYVLSALALAVSCTVYAGYADRLSSERFFKYILGSLAAVLALVWGLMQIETADWVYPLYYVVYEVASELILIHAGLYLNQNLDVLQSKRLVPLIFGGSQAGVILGGILLAVLSPLIGVSNLVLLWVLASVIVIALVTYWHKQQGMSPYYRAGRKRKMTARQTLFDVFQGVRFMQHSALLRKASFSLFFMVIMFYVLIYSVNHIYTDTFHTEEQLSSFFGMLVAVNSAIALVLQFFVANRLLGKLGVKTVNLFFPVTSVISYLMLMFSFTLPSALFGSFNKDVVMTAFRNPVWSLMMNALPANIQGRARAMTVAIVIPSALLVAGVVLMIVKELQSPVYIAVVGLISAALYLFYSKQMNRVYVKEIISQLNQKLALPDAEAQALKGGNDGILQELVKGTMHSDDQIFLAYAGSLVKTFPEQAAEIIISRLPQAESKARDQAVRLLLPLGSAKLADTLWELMGSADERFQSTCYFSLFKLKDERAREKIPELLAHPQARFRAVGIFGVYALGLPEFQDVAHKAWVGLLEDTDLLSNMFAIELMAMHECMPDTCNLGLCKINFKPGIERLMQAGDAHSCLDILNVTEYLTRCDQLWFRSILQGLSDHVSRDVRIACLESWMKLEKDVAVKGIEPSLEDSHPEVRELAAGLLDRLALYSSRAKNERLTSTSGSSPRAQSAILQLLLSDNVSQGVMADVVAAKLKEVEQFSEAAGIVRHMSTSHDEPSLNVLSLLLEERMFETLDLTLQALQGSEDAETIRVIRMGMQSGEKHMNAKACEALYGLSNKPVVQLLTRILESSYKQKSHYFSEGIAQVLEWCMNRQDPWLKQCASSTKEVLAT